MSFQAPFLDVDAQHRTGSHKFKVGLALGFIGGSCLAVLGVMALQNPSAAAPTNLIGAPTSLRMNGPNPMVSKNIRDLPGPSPWKELAITAIEATSRDRDVSMNAMNRLKSGMESMSAEDKAVVSRATAAVTGKAQDLMKAGQTAPLGFWDPLGFATNTPYGKMAFYREAEVKHGRVGMLASLGIFVSEKLDGAWWGGDITGPAAYLGAQPSYAAAGLSDLQESSLQAFWAAIFVCTALPELTFQLAPYPLGVGAYPDKTDRIPGDQGFDPLYLKPSDPAALLEIQNKEINNGRLAMLAAAGMIAQELATGNKIF